MRELLQGPMTDETREKYKLLSGVEHLRAKILTVPYPEDGTIYEYRFIKDVSAFDFQRVIDKIIFKMISDHNLIAFMVRFGSIQIKKIAVEVGHIYLLSA